MNTPHPFPPRHPAAEPLEPRTLLAASPSLIDLNPDPRFLTASTATPLGNQTFFTLDSTAGNELWKSDGTRKGTRLVSDINPGLPSSHPANLTPLDGDALLFSATGKDGHALWRSDGTRKGTVPVKPIPNGRIESIAAANGLVFFSIDRDKSDTDALWVSDGSAKGTRLLFKQKGRDIRWPLTTYRKHVLFTTQDDDRTQTLWRSDGTPKRTRPLPHIDAPSIDLRVLGKHLIYVETRDSERRLWKASFKRAKLLKDFGPARGDPSTSLQLLHTLADGRALLNVYDEKAGHRLWTTDGTPRGTTPFADLDPDDEYDSPHSIVEVAGALFSTTSDGVEGARLWKSDPATGVTTLLRSFDEGAGELTPFADRLLFTATEDDVAQFWTTDGTIDGTKRLTRFGGHRFTGLADPIGIVYGQSGGQYLFTADDGAGHALWTTDGTRENTRRLRRVPNTTKSSSPSGLAVSNETLYFGTYNIPGSAPWGPLQTGDGSLWKLPAGAAAPEKIIDIDGTVEQVIPANDGVTYFTVSQTYNWWGIAHPQTHYYLWRTDGTAAGTRRALEDPIQSSMTNNQQPPLALVGDTLYFANDDQLWSTRGTDESTRLVLDAQVGTLTAVGQTLYVRDYDNGIWAIHDTTAPRPIVSDTNITAMQSVAGRVYFTTSRRSTDKPDTAELWTFTPADETPVLVKQFPSGSSIYDLYAADGLLLFPGWDPDTGSELWKSDGTPQGTTLIKDLHQGPEGSRPRDMITIGDVTYFIADDDAHGAELWGTDGTPKGTSLVLDIRAGKERSLISHMRNVAGHLLFSADDGTHGREPWILRPNEPPSLLADINPGPEGSDPADFTAHDGLLYFSAIDHLHGRELWSAPL